MFALSLWLRRCEVGEEGIGEFTTKGGSEFELLEQLHQLIFGSSTLILEGCPCRCHGVAERRPTRRSESCLKELLLVAV